MSEKPAPIGDIRYYRHISILIVVAIGASAAILLWLNSTAGRAMVQSYFGERPAFGLQLFFWGALGSAIASSLFLARDKEENELESVKSNPAPSVLRYPTDIDIHLYAHRILTSACLAVVGALFLYAGLSYFDLPAELVNPKHRAFFMLFTFLVGLYQGQFVAFLNKRFQRMLEKSGPKGQRPPGQPDE